MMREESTVAAAEQELSDRLWYRRHLRIERWIESGKPDDSEWVDTGPEDPETWARARAHADEIEARYGIESLAEEEATIEGKLTAIRWTLGGEWDEPLDT